MIRRAIDVTRAVVFAAILPIFNFKKANVVDVIVEANPIKISEIIKKTFHFSSNS